MSDSDDSYTATVRTYATDAAPRCPSCRDSGFTDGRFCSCAAGAAWRTSPRVTIGDRTMVFPPGTTMEEAREVLNEAKRLHDEGLS